MIKNNKIGKQGQTALILILMTAAALIFLAISMNWGRVAQTKSLVSIAADQSAALLASDAASYGEMEKQTYLGNVNRKSDINWKIVIGIIVIIIAIIITICTWGATTGLLVLVIGVVAAEVVMVLAVIMAIVSLLLQLVVINPMMENMWNSMQKNQPVQQQFYEQGLGVALMNSITDQVNITDYFDLNSNGVFGWSTQNHVSNDTINRFAFFYTDRLRMLNKGDIPQVVFFYNQLIEFLNGSTCAQNYSDNQNYPGVPLNPSCMDPSTGTSYLDFCIADPSDPFCQGKVPSTVTCTQNAYENEYAPHFSPSIPGQGILNPNCPTDCVTNSSVPPTDPLCQMMVPNAFSFQFTDPCVDGDSSSSTYNPICDPCCQPFSVANPTYDATASPAQSPYKHLRPAGCPEPASFPNSTSDPCATSPNSTKCTCNPSASAPDTPISTPDCISPQCINKQFNPYTDGISSFPYIYDPTYQEYSNGLSFLDLYGRDQPMVPSGTTPPLTDMSIFGNFPNGIYPFFWLMKNYSPQVDNIDDAAVPLKAPQYHWCVMGSTESGGTVPAAPAAPTGFADLDQLVLPTVCTGRDCCVNFLPDTTSAGSTATSAATIVTVPGTSAPPTSPVSVSITSVYDNTTSSSSGPYTPGDSLTITATATETGQTSLTVAFQLSGGGCAGDAVNVVSIGNGTQSGSNYSITITIPVKVSSYPPTTPASTMPNPGGTFTLTATATDALSPPNSATSSPYSLTIAPAPGGTCGPVASAIIPPSKGNNGTSSKLAANAPVWKEAITSFITGGPAPAPRTGPAVTLSVTVTDANGNNVPPPFTSVPDGDTLTLSSTVSGGSPSGISYYYSSCTANCSSATPTCSSTSTLIGSSTTGPSYTVPWVNPLSAGSYCLIAQIPNASGGASVNGVIDLVGDPSIPNLSYVNAAAQNNPALDMIFGANISSVSSTILTPPGGQSCGTQPCTTTGSTPNSTVPWQPGDNQMCIATYPYNGMNWAFPDGTCEWTDSLKQPYYLPTCASGTCNYTTGYCPNGTLCIQHSKPDLTIATDSTIDSLDDTMHTLSDFLQFTQHLLQKDVGSLSSTFDSWYSSAAVWIAPQCPYVAVDSRTGSSFYDRGVDPQQNNATCEASTDPNCTLPDLACNPNSNGRLLSIYEPLGYPGVTTPSGFGGIIPPQSINFTGNPPSSNIPTDVLASWNQVITQWLNNVYTTPATTVPPSAQPWCVPPAVCSSGACSDGGQCSDGTQCISTSTAEGNYIDSNSNTITWGDLAHVSTCLNYNAGWTPAKSTVNTSNFEQCLTALNATTCPATLPNDCDLSSLGLSVEPAYGSLCDDGSSCGHITAGHITAGHCKDGSVCTNDATDIKYKCRPYYINMGTATAANPSGVPSFAKWVSDSIEFGVLHNYKQCLDLLQNECPASLSGTVCDSAILGRSLYPLPSTTHAYVGGSGSKSCDPANAGYYAKWVQDSYNLFSDENPKFLLRAKFINDLYNRATTMQNILTQGDVALHNFLKPCGGCADGTQCRNYKCDDNSACGPPACPSGGYCSAASLCSDGSACNFCANGGPAAQLIYRRNQENFPAASLPNSVIYGWTEQNPTGGSGGCIDDNGSRVGCAHIVKVTAYSPGRQGNAPGSLLIQNALPNIHMFTSWEWWIDPLTIWFSPPIGIPWLDWVLNQRDGYVYVSVKRWDQNHATSCSNGNCVNGKCSSDGSACGGPVSFPNKRPLWQMMFNNPNPNSQSSNNGGNPLGSGLPSECLTSVLPAPSGVSSNTLPAGTTFGYGLQLQTVQALSDLMNSSDPAVVNLGKAFMLNDNGNGQVDANANNQGFSCAQQMAGNYCKCLSDANQLLNTGTVSYACAEYIAWRNAAQSSPAGVTGVYEQPSTFSFSILPPGAIFSGHMPPNPAEHDYSLKFVDCNTLLKGQTPPEDLKTN